MTPAAPKQKKRTVATIAGGTTASLIAAIAILYRYDRSIEDAIEEDEQKMRATLTLTKGNGRKK